MSSFVDALPFFNRRTSPMEEAEGVGRDGLHVNHAAVARISLGQLLKRVGDANAADQHVLEIDQIVAANTPEFGRSIPFVLSFSDLTYSVKARKKFSGTAPNNRKVLLDSISGEAREGEIMAVIGASGSGKSTLIDALANRIAKESLKGSVTLNGELLESNLLKMISAYVMQEDLLYPMLTVEETLMFAAEFRLPRSLSKSKKKTRVEALIDQLGLRRAAGTIIGDDGHRGVSGGERRRVSIGIDIIHDPIILFLDEPTSGLDSTSAFMVVKVLRRIAQSGSIVITSIHQPSSRIIGLLDRLLFLSRGQTVYSGSPAALPQFFAEFGRPIPENENRTEFALDLIRELDSDEASGGTNPLVEFHRSWTSSTNSPVFSVAKQSNTASTLITEFGRPIPQNENRTEFRELDSDEASGGTKPLVEFHRSRNSNSPVFAAAKQSNTAVTLKDAISASISRGKLGSATVSRFANPFWTEMMVLTRRAGTNSRRLPELFLMRLGAVLVTGFILATIFWRLDSSPKGVQERLGFFAIAMSTMFYTCADALPVFLQERYIFMRETAYNAYRRSSYVLSNTLVGFPALILLSGAFAGTTFFAVGLAGGTQGFIFFFLIVLASFWAGSGFVTFLSGIVSHVMLGYTIVVAILAYFLLFSGFFITGDRIPGYWIWFHYLSLVKYPYEAVLQNEFGDPRKCFVRGIQMFDNTPFSVLPAEAKLKVLQGISGSLGLSLTSETCITTGTGILKQQAVTDLSKWSCLAVTVAWGFFFRVLFYFTLLVGSKNKRR